MYRWMSLPCRRTVVASALAVGTPLEAVLQLLDVLLEIVQVMLDVDFAFVPADDAVFELAVQMILNPSRSLSMRTIRSLTALSLMRSAATSGAMRSAATSAGPAAIIQRLARAAGLCVLVRM